MLVKREQYIETKLDNWANEEHEVNTNAWGCTKVLWFGLSVLIWFSVAVTVCSHMEPVVHPESYECQQSKQQLWESR